MNATADAVVLFRPVGAAELELVRASGYCAFPPRLEGQPIFYPVTNERYATEIAERWNARLDADRVGYVTRFRVAADYLGRYQKKIVGASWCEEYWIPAEELDEFNRNIIGEIEVVARFDGAPTGTERDADD
jgi:hypothetical protein